MNSFSVQTITPSPSLLYPAAVQLPGTALAIECHFLVLSILTVLVGDLLEKISDCLQHLLGCTEVVLQLDVLFLQLEVLGTHIGQLLRQLLVATHQLRVGPLKAVNILL